MITINLLPIEFRRKIEQTHVVSMRFGMMLTCLIAFIVWIGLSFMVGTAKRELENMSADWSRLDNGSKEADKIMLDINQNFLERKKACDLISSSDMSWAYVLNQISDLLPDPAWIKKVKLSSNGVEEWEFWIKGLGKTPENEPAIKALGRFVNVIRPSLEQQLMSKEEAAALRKAGKVPEVESKELNVQTSTAQEMLGDNALTAFDATFTMRGKKMKVFGINLNLPDFKQVDPKEKKFLAVTGGIIAIILLVGIIPNISELFQVSSKMSQMKSKSRIAEEKIKNLPQLRNNRKAYVDQIVDLEKQFFDLDQVAELIGMISEMAKESGITIISSKQYEYKGTTLSPKSFYRPILIKLELEGRYHNFGKFVNLLERNPKLIQISEMNIEPSEKKKDKLAIEVSILTFLKIGEGVAA